MATKGPEYAVKLRIKEQLNSLGPDCWWYMPVAGPFSIAGVPDFIGIYKGKGFGIEAKAENGKVTPHQKRQLGMIAAAKGFSVIVRGVEDAKLVASMLRVWAGESQEGGA
jgi:hypothetical protein